MDLSRLSIERDEAEGAGREPGPRRAPRGRRVRLGPWLLLLALAGAGWLLRAPLLRALDRVRLREVETAVVYRPAPGSGTSLSGTSANGYVVARNRAALSADAPGRIVEMRVEEGTVVSAGDVVARLYAEEFEAAVRSAEAQVEVARAGVVSAEARVTTAQRALAAREADVEAAGARIEGAEAERVVALAELERARQLVEDSFVTRRALDRAVADEAGARSALAARTSERHAAEAALEQARGAVAEAEAGLTQARAEVPVREALLAQARATLDKTYVRAPFDGVVVLKDAEVGEVVSPNSQGGNSRGSVATLVDFASLEVQVELQETNLGAVRVGEPARIRLDARPEHLYAGTVQRIWPTANRQKGTIEVRVGFDDPDDQLRPEMGAHVVFTAEEPAPAQEGPLGLALPRNAVVRAEGAEGVFVLERDTLRWQPLTITSRGSGTVRVREGLQEGDRVVLDPAPDLRDGERVRVP